MIHFEVTPVYTNSILRNLSVLCHWLRGGDIAPESCLKVDWPLNKVSLWQWPWDVSNFGVKQWILVSSCFYSEGFVFQQQCVALVQHVHILVNHLRKWVRKAWQRLNYHSGVKLSSTKSWLMQLHWKMSINRRLGTGWNCPLHSLAWATIEMQFYAIPHKANKKFGNTFQRACHLPTSSNRFTQYLANWWRKSLSRKCTTDCSTSLQFWVRG